MNMLPAAGALAWWSAASDAPPNLTVKSGADGVTTPATRAGFQCLTLKPNATPPSLYLYFDAPPSVAPVPGGPLFVTVEYFDEILGGAIGLEYDSTAGDGIPSAYRLAEDRAGGWLLGTKRWKTAIFLLRRPLFRNRQNLGSDFRLTGTRLFVRTARITSRRPVNWEKVNRMETVDVKPLVKIGSGGQLIVGGFDPPRREDAAPQARALEAMVPALKQLGVTSHEGYVRWNLCETAPGQYDWSAYDRFAEVYRRHGLKWVPFLIIGSAYSLPDWYFKKPGSQGYVCLEHGEESDVESLWNPTLRKHVARFLQAFCAHYGKTGVIESILLGITGNYGEAIYVATGNDWTADIHGPYHTHPGYWAGDPYAVKSFQSFLAKRYESIDRLNAAWTTPGGALSTRNGFGEIRPFLKKDAPNDAAWLDFTGWYIDSMNEWARFWMTETRRSFPKGDIYLCTGGHAPPEHGADFGEQCRIAAEVKGGVRITNEASDYKANFTLTRWVASAGRQYGAYFSFEPAGAVDENGVIARIYNATASGAKGLHYYFPNLFGSDNAKANFVRWGSAFRRRTPKVEIAVYYPETKIRLEGDSGRFLNLLQPFRDRFDFDFMSDAQIRDGGLKRVRALFLMSADGIDPDSRSRIEAWAKAGGALIIPGRSPEASPAFPSLSGDRFHRIDAPGESVYYRAGLTGILRESPALSPETRAMVAADGEEDGLFVTLIEPNELLWYNSTDREASRAKGVPAVTLPPFGIASQKVPS